MESSRARQRKDAGRKPSPSTWSALAVLSLAMAAGGISAYLEAGPRFDWLLLMTAMGLTAAVAMRLLADNAAERETANRYAGDPLKDLLDSAGPIVVSVSLDGHLTYINPTGERLLGYHAEELINQIAHRRPARVPAKARAWWRRCRRTSGVERPAERIIRAPSGGLCGDRSLSAAEPGAELRNASAPQRRKAVSGAAACLGVAQPGRRADRSGRPWRLTRAPHCAATSGSAKPASATAMCSRTRAR